MYFRDIYENGEYIVKAKNKEINLKYAPKRNIAFLIISAVLVVAFSIIAFQTYWINIIIYVILCIAMVLNFFMWELDIKDGKILVKCLLTPVKYTIKFEQIINIRVKEKEYSENNGILLKKTSKYLEIEYLKNKKIRRIKLDCDYNMKEGIYEFMTTFCTNKMLEHNPNLENEYMDIRDKELDDYIRNLKENKMQQEYNNEKIAKVVIILAIVVFIVMTYIIVSSNGYI